MTPELYTDNRIMPDLAPAASTGKRNSPIPAIAPSLSAKGERVLGAPDSERRLDAVPAPAHLQASDANIRSAFPRHQSQHGAMGSARYPLVRARLYRRPGPRLVAHSPDRVRRPLLAW